MPTPLQELFSSTTPSESQNSMFGNSLPPTYSDYLHSTVHVLANTLSIVGAQKLFESRVQNIFNFTLSESWMKNYTCIGCLGALSAFFADRTFSSFSWKNRLLCATALSLTPVFLTEVSTRTTQSLPLALSERDFWITFGTTALIPFGIWSVKKIVELAAKHSE